MSSSSDDSSVGAPPPPPESESDASDSGYGSDSMSSDSDAPIQSVMAVPSSDDSDSDEGDSDEDVPIHNRQATHISIADDELDKQKMQLSGGRKGSSARKRGGVCDEPGCNAFSVRGEWCLKHVWRQRAPLEGKSKCQLVCEELISTELTYFRGLEKAQRWFLKRLTERCAENRPIIGEADIKSIFCNLEDILQVSKQLHADLTELQRHKCLLANVGAMLMHYAPKFEVYLEYLKNYDRSVEVLKRLKKRNPELKKFISLQESCEGSLASFLITPIQRLPRYLLLLRELIRRAGDDEEQRKADLHSAEKMIKEVATSINSRMQDQQNAQDLAALAARFVKDKHYQDVDIKGRVIIKELSMNVRSKGGLKQQAIILFTDAIVAAHKKKGKGQVYTMTSLLSLNKMQLQKQFGAKSAHDLELTAEGPWNSNETLVLSSPDKSVMEETEALIRKAIDEETERVTARARSMGLSTRVTRKKKKKKKTKNRELSPESRKFQRMLARRNSSMATRTRSGSSRR